MAKRRSKTKATKKRKATGSFRFVLALFVSFLLGAFVMGIFSGNNTSQKDISVTQVESTQDVQSGSAEQTADKVLDAEADSSPRPSAAGPVDVAAETAEEHSASPKIVEQEPAATSAGISAIAADLSQEPNNAGTLIEQEPAATSADVAPIAADPSQEPNNAGTLNEQEPAASSTDVAPIADDSSQDPASTDTLVEDSLGSMPAIEGPTSEADTESQSPEQSTTDPVEALAPVVQKPALVEVEGTVTAYFFNVGQGDSEFLVLNDGTTILIDAGEEWAGDNVVWYISEVLGYDRIDWLVATHPHADHIGGMATVLYSPIYIENIVAPEIANDTETFWNFLNAVETVNKQITPAVAGLVLHDSGGCRVEVLSPRAGASYDELNDWSVVIKLTFGNTSMLFTGDASYKVVSALGVGHVDVLKAGHHGSEKSMSLSLLDELSPSYAVIEVGWNNDYGHPSIETLDELDYCGIETWRTDVDGVVVATSDGNTVSVRSDTGAASPTPRSEVEARKAAEQAEAERIAAEQAAAIAQAQAQSEAAYDEAVAETYSAGETVYITDNGEKYHRDGCRYLKNSKHAIGKNDAKAMGYTPCKVCKPGN